jgi:hypothetical protein
MCADLLITALVIDADREPDFAAARAAVDLLGPEQIDVPDEFWDHDIETDEGLEAIREELRASLAELEEALPGSRELASFALRGATVYVTGGLCWGDPPTELFHAFSRLWAVPAVLSAAGFEVER